MALTSEFFDKLFQLSHSPDSNIAKNAEECLQNSLESFSISHPDEMKQIFVNNLSHSTKSLFSLMMSLTIIFPDTEDQFEIYWEKSLQCFNRFCKDFVSKF